MLTESYLYTRQAIEESLEHLDPDGVLAVQFGEFNFEDKPNRTARYVATARKALSEMGIEDPTKHILVARDPLNISDVSQVTILVKKTEFTNADVRRFTASLGQVPDAKMVYAQSGDFEPSPVSQVVETSNAELDEFIDSYPYDVSPVTDNGPFFWHFTPFDDVISDFDTPISREDFEVAIGERVLLLLLGVAILFALVFLLLPFVTIRETWKKLPRKRLSAVYFGSLGLGFLFFEITLIQRLTLFLGYPTYSLTVTLGSILIFTGIGALLSGRYTDRKTSHPSCSAPWAS